MFGSNRKKSATPVAGVKAIDSVDVSKLSPRDLIAYKIGQLSGEHVLRYKLAEKRGGGFATIRPNPNYPGKKQRKYLLVWSTEKEVAGEGNIRLAWDLDEPKELAKWILYREGEQIV